ncbi:MAG: cation diffusion facilitator family transporter [Bacilli bacterium]
MKKERKVLIFSALINVVVSVLKIVGGVIFSSFTLIADGFYTVSDFVTDLIALISGKISHKRANKKFPFGFGKFEYITEMFIGIFIFLMGLFILIKSFFITYSVTNMNVIFIVLIVIFLKVLSSSYLLNVGKEIRSSILNLSAKESFIDVLSSIFVLLIILLGQFIPSIDFLGSILIGLLISTEGIKIIINNVIALIGKDENNDVIKEKIKKIINSNKNVLYSDSFLIKYGSYYDASIEIAINDDVNIKELIKIELKIKKDLKSLKENIKFVDFNIISK